MKKLITICLVVELGLCSVGSAAYINWVGAKYTDPAGAWEAAVNWSSSPNLPTLSDTVRVYHAADSNGSNVTISTLGVALVDKFQMKYSQAHLTINNGADLTVRGAVEMFNGTSSMVDILAGGVWNTCTLDSGVNFNLSTQGNSTDTVNVWGTLNVDGTPNPILYVGGASGSGTINIYGGSSGVVFVDQYTIGTGGVINMWAGGIFKIKGNVISQTQGDIDSGKIVGQGVSLTTYYKSGEDRTYVNPEPATVCLLGLGALSLIRRKK